MPLRILLADENLAVQKLVEMTLCGEDMDVTITDNGLSALDIAIKQRPDLILADYKMEGLDITSFVSKAKKREDISSIPIVLLVDSGEAHDPAYLQTLGVEAFLKKPIDTQELKTQVKSLNLLSEPELEETGKAPPGQSDLSQHFTSADDDTDMIADLLGWSTPEDHQQTVSGEAVPEEEAVEPDDTEMHIEQSNQIQIDPIIQENDFDPFEAQEESSKTSEEQSPDSDTFSFETGGLLSDEEEVRPILEEAVQDTEENNLLQPPAYGESVVVPQHGDDLLTTHQESETESPPFTFEENDPFEQSEEADFEKESQLRSDSLDASPASAESSDSFETIQEQSETSEDKEETFASPPPFPSPIEDEALKEDTSDTSLETSEPNNPFETLPEENETGEDKGEEHSPAPPLLPSSSEAPALSTQDASQEQTRNRPNETVEALETVEMVDPDIGEELIKKTVQAVHETAERIVKEMLPGLVKSSLSQEMISPIVEGVVWEMIPPLAEAEIKKEIKRLQPEKKES